MEIEEQDKIDNHPLSPFTRGLIVALHMQEMAYSQILEQLELEGKRGSLSSISRICSQWDNDRTYNTNYQRCGRKKALNQNEINDIVQKVKANPQLSRRQLEENKEINPKRLSGQTIVNYLKEQGLKLKVRPSTFFISSENKLLQVQWCKRMLAHGKRVLHSAIYSDESYIYYNQDYKKYVWIEQDEEIPQSQMKVIKKWEKKVLVWAAIHINGPLSIQFIDGNLNSQNYKQILEQFYFQEGNIRYRECQFQQDNAPPHKTAEIFQFFLKNDIKVMEFPAYSPDLAPIELVWFTLKKIISDTEEEISTLEQFKKVIQFNFFQSKKIKDCIRKSINKIPELMTKVIQNKGDSIVL
ncbi:hypothetical protein ABPG72_012109 [Tetrahymena utriculariae]